MSTTGRFWVSTEGAGIEGFRFHDLRHTFASHFVMRGGSLYDLKEILGHSDIKMTMRYAYLSPHHLHGSIAKVEGLARMPAAAHRTAQRAVASVAERGAWGVSA